MLTWIGQSNQGGKKAEKLQKNLQKIDDDDDSSIDDPLIFTEASSDPHTSPVNTDNDNEESMLIKNMKIEPKP